MVTIFHVLVFSMNFKQKFCPHSVLSAVRDQDYDVGYTLTQLLASTGVQQENAIS